MDMSNDEVKVVEISAHGASTTFIAAGEWLRQQAAAGARWAIEDIDWMLPHASSPGYSLILTVSSARQENS